MNPKPAALLAERLRSAVGALRVALPAGDLLSLTASFGVSALAEGDSVDTLLARADAGLYAAKRAGRNRVRAGS